MGDNSTGKWGKAAKKPKRAVTIDEHHRIITAEENEERRRYYEMLWLIGAAQTDCSLMAAENVDWQTRVLSYQRRKTKEWAHLQIGKALEALLNHLPKQGFLFPKIAGLKDTDRSAEFSRRCRILGIKGISLHSYRYAWAERARIAGYAERYAQAALGHKCSAVHHAYAKRAKVVCPPLEDAESKIISLEQKKAMENSEGEPMKMTA